ncbi:MAG TPA: ABC transporter substrate-binding protein [Burkholderiales bacterium]|nr:ABC transporter substrate-binding protein [Burkholderiales bacterium]
MMMTRSVHFKNTRKEFEKGVLYKLVLTACLLVTLVWVTQAWAQTDTRRVGVLSFATVADDPNVQVVLNLFRQQLASRGWIEGDNIAFEYASARGDPFRFAEAALQLSRRKVDVIFATSAPALRAAYAATHSIPIVAGDFTTDPVAEGYIQSSARPGGNVTGIFLDAPEFAGKWFELLRAMIPDLSLVAVMWDPGAGATHLQAVRNVAEVLALQLQVIEVRKAEEVPAAFAALNDNTQAIIFLPSPMIYNQSARLASLALQHRLPATSMAREFALAGGTLAYGPERASTWERSAVFVDRILTGHDPAELPVERPARIQLVVNLRTARVLGVTVPEAILLRADEVVR